MPQFSNTKFSALAKATALAGWSNVGFPIAGTSPVGKIAAKVVAIVSFRARMVGPVGLNTRRWTFATAKVLVMADVTVLMLCTVPLFSATHAVVPSGVIATSTGCAGKTTVKRIVSVALSKIATELESVL